MRRLTALPTLRRPRRPDHGFSGVMVGLLLPVLVAGVGLSVDSGKMVLQRGAVQKAADSAALAIGQDCARASRTGATTAQKDKCSPAGALTTAQLMVNGNATGATVSVPGSIAPGTGSATITVTRSVPMTFGAAVGVGPKTATSSATVTWGLVPTAASTFPLGMNVCDYNAWKISPSSTPKLYRYDIYQSGRGVVTDARTCAKPGGGTDRSIYGALWLIDEIAPWFSEAGCKVSTSIGITATLSSTNILFPAGCTARARALVAGKTYLLPIYDSPTFLGVGTTLFPRIRGYAPFVITGWRVGGWLGIFDIVTGGSNSPACSSGFLINNCRGIQGYFTGSIIQLDEVDSYGVNPDADFGSVRVKLTS